MLLAVGAQILPAERLDYLAEPVGARPVFPAGSRVGDEWYTVEHRVPEAYRVDATKLVVAQQIGVAERVAEPRGVGEQLTNARLADRGTQPRRLTVEALQHLQLSESRQHACDRLLELQAALLDQLQRGDARDRLGHRRDREHRVHLCGLLAVDAQAPERTLIQRSVAVSDDGDGARERSAGHRVLE